MIVVVIFQVAFQSSSSLKIISASCSSWRCYLQILQRFIQTAWEESHRLFIILASPNELHHPHAHGQCHADGQSAQPVLCEADIHLGQSDDALQQGVRLPAGEHWSSHHRTAEWAENHRHGCTAAAFPLSMPSARRVSFWGSWMHTWIVSLRISVYETHQRKSIISEKIWFFWREMIYACT